MRRVRTAFIGFAVALMTSLLLARAHPFGDPGLYATKAAQAPIMEHSSVPPEVRAALVAKCADCHSPQTRPPIYGRFAPVSWLMERDIVEGRRRMNLALWDTYSADQQESFKAKIVQQTRAHEMPLVQYRMIHWNSRITDANVRAFAQWARDTPGLEAGTIASPIREGDPVRGKEVFEKRCTGCHALESNREGPRLHTVFGRISGTVAGFPYSAALMKAHIVWNDASLAQWLTDPDAFVPGNNMDFHVASPQERQDLVRFLKQEGINRSGN